MPEVRVDIERWPIAGGFTISRGTRTEAVVVVVTLTEGSVWGRGESVPYARYGETPDGVVESIRGIQDALTGGLTRQHLRDRLPAGAARNAVDAALWDLESKRTGRRAWDLAGVAAPPERMVTAETLSIAAPEAMRDKAAALADRPLLKIKVGAEGALERIAAVRDGAPAADLIVDANEAWSLDQLRAALPALARLRVGLLEQPLPADQDAALVGLEAPVPLCADESAHVTTDIERLAPLYDAVNVKLDKTGGLTEALEMTAAARATGLGVMVGCMVGTSLAMAPATVIASGADFVDLDGPVLLGKDRVPGIAYDRGWMSPPPGALWG
ncbi:dipeptide epimerase [Roseospira marina]|uniref:Dipeptide epimerase n=1 Tax=Roseospira marina TaxID=140057 RepID=A0A5M6IE58_9PROT|nr:N-acetyl-D-Glu racemase DgcA [Roseospira marina]KAA5605868.1 dipeptide epimerase [Roseospira marina]MBB4313688.1 L-alanine-DL-glutamate epimerase-like enolase superfamily enzyme [Roseospira marina]MBB5086850.1 L-alanine-DL-glutamate epimerase-like enolase superfamily enzyme [Roseospira marina]